MVNANEIRKLAEPLAKAEQLVASGAVYAVAGLSGYAVVRNGDGTQMYLVRFEAGHEHCTCPEWEHRQSKVNAPCKHIPAAQLRAASDVPQAEGKLEQLKGTIGRPQRMAVDNGPEFISKALDAWAYRHRVRLEFSQPGKPTANASVESFNGHLREECLNQHWFETLAEAREVIEAWRVEYNEERPHRALQQRTPVTFLASWEPLATAAD